mmetsp:Transcript_5435/g.5974  ORF Transcript_5435/g.5974 Transcript_5435/m.5974 type:complete len:99 (-) Transcript_5435:79-375(-)
MKLHALNIFGLHSNLPVPSTQSTLSHFPQVTGQLSFADCQLHLFKLFPMNLHVLNVFGFHSNRPVLSSHLPFYGDLVGDVVGVISHCLQVTGQKSFAV